MKAKPDETSYERMRQAVERDLEGEKVKRRRTYFRVNVAAYLVIMLIAWIIVPIIWGPFLTLSSTASIFLLSLLGLAEVLLHYAAVRLDTPEGERALRERLLGRALQDMMLDEEKAKRHMRLSDDGELVELTSEIEDAEQDAHPRTLTGT
jgi:hypothetical protein